MTSYERIPSYLARALSACAGTVVDLCDSRPASDDAFTLRDVPPTIELGTVMEHIAAYHGLDSTSLQHSSGNHEYDRNATLHVGGRARQPYAAINVRRDNNRVFVDISRIRPRAVVL